MPQIIPTTTGGLIELGTSEDALRKLYFDVKFNTWRDLFIRNNAIKIRSAIKKKNDLIDEYFEMEGEGENKKIKYVSITKEGENEPTSNPVLKEGKTLEEYESEFKKMADKKDSMVL